MWSKTVVVGIICLCSAQIASAQDTVRVSLDQFIQRGINNSGQVDADRQDVKLADNQVSQTKSKRYLPKFELSTQHGVVPGVESNREDLDKDEYYLDPNLENDWNNWAIFTRAEVTAVQPIYTWGALKNAVKATKAAANAAGHKFDITKDETALRLYKLYQSYLLSLEVQRLLDEAQKQLGKISDKLDEQEHKKNSNLDESDLFKFKVFKSEFGSRAGEVKENAKYIQRIWNYVLQAGDNTVYIPEKQFLDPVQNPLKEVDFYRQHALSNRPEIKALQAGIKAANYGVKATKEQNYPKLYMGLTGSYANTPNRPRQSNPFIINNTNYASASVGFGIQQNLDFFSMRYDVQESEIKHKKAEYSKAAAMDGITLEINEKYKNASVSKIKMENTDEALITAKKWVRQEQLDYDFDMGDPKDLIDAIQKELELKVQYEQQIFNFNQDMAELFKSAAIPVTDLNAKYSD